MLVDNNNNNNNNTGNMNKLSTKSDIKINNNIIIMLKTTKIQRD